MTAIVLDGKKVGDELRSGLQKKIASLSFVPHLVVLQVGDDPASNVYIGIKKKMCERVGIQVTHVRFDAGCKQEEVMKKISECNDDKDVHGILLQLPLPTQLDVNVLTHLITPSKDVDGVHPENLGKLCKGEKGVIPCTPKGIMNLLNAYSLDLVGKKVVILGRSIIVGKPLSLLLSNANATVTVCHSKTVGLKDICKQTDILVCAMGQPEMIDASYVKKGTVVVDVGISRTNGKLVGDTDFESVARVASYITPVPGGVGPMTIAMLLENMYELALAQNVK